MATIEIRKDKVEAMVRIATQSVASQIPNLHPLEALIGFAEVVGRVVAAQEGSYQVHNAMIDEAVKHIKNTVRAGYTSKGQNPNGIK